MTTEATHTEPEATSLEATVATAVPYQSPPEWALLQRQLFDELDKAWRVFRARYCDDRGWLIFAGTLAGRDGADDFYEPFFNWPALYMLGGSDDLLAVCKRQWESVTEQLTSLGFLVDEYERGYDWFHQGEALLFFYGICAADPEDSQFRARAERFAELYLAGSSTGNYDPAYNIIRAPHNGALGPRPGLGDEYATFSASLTRMRPYGLPLLDVQGIESWEDLADPNNALAMGEQMQSRLGRGDTAVNLCSTSLATNAWLYDHRADYAQWVARYVSGWRERMHALGGVMPDNVGPSGSVGELHDGHWYGGHYGWTWPHGYHTVGAAALVGAINAALISGDDSVLDLARAPLQQVLDQAQKGTVEDTEMSLGPTWAMRLQDDARVPITLVPNRHGPTGWFDFQPLQLAFPVWLWWFSMSSVDRARLDWLRTSSGYDWGAVRQFRDKEEAGHEAPWIAFLHGDNPNYPAEALRMALRQVETRLQLIAEDEAPPDSIDIHWWQRMNPVATEVLTQLSVGSPQVLYNGGLQLTRLRYADAVARRPGLPPDVAALITSLDDTRTVVSLVNLSNTEQRNVLVCGGAFGEHRIDSVSYTQPYEADPPHSATVIDDVGSSRIQVCLPPQSQVDLELQMTLRAYRPRHQTYR